MPEDYSGWMWRQKATKSSSIRSEKQFSVCESKLKASRIVEWQVTFERYLCVCVYLRWLLFRANVCVQANRATSHGQRKEISFCFRFDFLLRTFSFLFRSNSDRRVRLSKFEIEMTWSPMNGSTHGLFWWLISLSIDRTIKLLLLSS